MQSNTPESNNQESSNQYPPNDAAPDHAPVNQAPSEQTSANVPPAAEPQADQNPTQNTKNRRSKEQKSQNDGAKEQESGKSRADLTKETSPKTIGDLSRKGAGSDYRDYLEKIFREMEENNINPGEMTKIVNERAGYKFMSRSTAYKRHSRWKKNRREAVKDHRINNGRPRTKLSPGQLRALDLIIGYDKEYNSGLNDALAVITQWAPFIEIRAEDLPPLWRCHAERESQSTLQKLARNGNHKEVFEKMKFWTHNRTLRPNEEHNFDEGKLMFLQWKKNGKQYRVRVYFSMHVDAETFIVRNAHYDWREFKERDCVLALKKGLLPAPEIGLEHGCIPSTLRLDNATPHHGKSIDFINHWMDNRPNRQGKIIHSPPGQYWANPSAERMIGESKRKFWRKLVKDFYEYLREEQFNPAEDIDGLGLLVRIQPLLTAFLKKHNRGQTRHTDRPRLERYLNDSPKEAFDISAEEIHKNVLFVQQATLTNNGVKIDGVNFDAKQLYLYRGRSDTYVGVPPEGNSDFAVLFTMDDKGRITRIGELESQESRTLSYDKQNFFIEDCRTEGDANEKQIARMRAAKSKAEAVAEALAKSKEPAPPPVADTTPTEAPPPRETTAVERMPAPVRVRPVIQTRKAA